MALVKHNIFVWKIMAVVKIVTVDLPVWVFFYPMSCDQFSIFGLCMRLKFAEY